LVQLPNGPCRGCSCRRGCAGQRPGAGVGCGEGFSLAWLADHDWDAYGVDYSIVGLNSFHPHLTDRFRVADITHPLESVVRGERYDLVFVRNVLEHVLDPISLLENLKQLVTPSGICAVTVPNDASEWQENLLATGAVPRRFWIAIPDHISYFTANGLRNVATSTGWHCHRILAEFPIDWFLATPSGNYVTDPGKGQEAHAARMAVDTMLSRRPMNDVLAFFEALARVGMGRQITAILSLKP